MQHVFGHSGKRVCVDHNALGTFGLASNHNVITDGFIMWYGCHIFCMKFWNDYNAFG